MPLPSTMTPLQTITLGSATASITLTSIPNTYTDLVLVMNTAVSTVGNVIKLQYNSDTGTNYSNTNLYGDGSVVASTRTANVDGNYPAWYVDPDTTLTHITNVQIMNYSNTTTYKSILSRANRASASNFPGAETVVGLWRSTSAINSITIKSGASTGTLSSGSTFTLYGIKAA